MNEMLAASEITTGTAFYMAGDAYKALKDAFAVEIRGEATAMVKVISGAKISFIYLAAADLVELA